MLLWARNTHKNVFKFALGVRVQILKQHARKLHSVLRGNDLRKMRMLVEKSDTEK